MAYSCIQDYDTSLGMGNINSDPMFVDPAGLDWMYGTLDDNLHLSSDSPCIDAGDGSAVPVELQLDLDGYPRCMDDPYTVDTGIPAGPDFDPNGVVDMGAYEFVQDVVYFEDANLKAAVEKELLLKPGVSLPITVSDMEKLEYLKASSLDIYCLKGLGYAVNLKTLYLDHNKIIDFEPIAGLTKLIYVNLSYNYTITEIPNLSSWGVIESLYLHSNKISDIANLAVPEISTLKRLYIITNLTLPLEAYQVHIPAIRANNPNLIDFRYDNGCTPLLSGDINQDCKVDIMDFAMMCENWLNCTHMYSEMCQ